MSYKIKIFFPFILVSLCLSFNCKKELKVQKSGFNVKTTLGKHLTPRQMLGKKMFFDRSLSNPPGESCATCHDPIHGFDDPRKRAESPGAVKGRAGNRNAPTAAYAAFAPYFHYDEKGQEYIGGQFWDGRAPTLAEQAKGPLLNPLEMDNPDKKSVVDKIRKSPYTSLFEEVYGPGSLDEVETAYNLVADAIAAYEETAELNSFSSKYDLYLEGKLELTDQEMRGLAIFEDEKKGDCSACHPSRPDSDGNPPHFTDYSYDNLGIAKNPENPFYHMPIRYNPEGEKYIDLGLGVTVKKPSENGKFKVPTLRNVALTAPYMHNGVFKTLKEVVDFYNTRDTAKWPPPEFPETVNKKELGNLGLNSEEIDSLLAFLMTLADGFGPDHTKAKSMQ